ncbi:MAG: hypothetical protein AAF434_06355 [Pseudomonadota bacterium]
MSQVKQARVNNFNRPLCGLRVVLVCLAASLLTVAQADIATYSVTAEEWSRPRSGRGVSELPGLREFVQNWMQAGEGNRQILIQYPGGESGTLWASELRDWLVALSIPSEHILLEAGSPSGDELLVRIENQ